MTVTHAVKNAFNNLMANKTRTFLTLLGMVIGISSVIIIMAVGAGAQSLIINQITQVGGSNLVGVLPGATDEHGAPAAVMGITVTTLTYNDALALAQTGNVTHVTDVAAYVKGTGTVSWQNRSVDTNFVGTTASYINVEEAKVALGRFISEEEENAIARVAVLGSQVADELFGDQDPLGATIKIRRENFKVIGVMEPRGVVFFQNQDDQVFVPLKTAQKLLLGINHVSFIRSKVDLESNVEQTVEEVKMTLRERHGITNPEEDDFTVRDVKNALSILTNVTNGINFFLAAIAAISLIVGGVGIMNIMLVAVNERIQEIGLRKAVGAKKSSILTQFLVETIVIAFSGGLVGILLGSLAAVLITVVVRYLGYNWDLIISIFSISLATSVSVLVGLIFGIYPARRAAKLDPIEALHYE